MTVDALAMGEDELADRLAPVTWEPMPPARCFAGCSAWRCGLDASEGPIAAAAVER